MEITRRTMVAAGAVLAAPNFVTEAQARVSAPVRDHASTGIVPGSHVNARDCRQITRGRRSDVNGARPWDRHFRTDRDLLCVRTCSIAQAEDAGR
jgi:hypothetical protein